MSKIYIIGAGILMLIVQTAFLGCTANYGSLRGSRDVTHVFETYKILVDYRYYYSGADTEPDAIIGIDRHYQLSSKLWKEVALTSTQLKNWIDRMNQTYDFPVSPFGSSILDAAGKQIGIWYSVWDTTIVKMEKDNQIVVHTPDLPLQKIKFIDSSD
ncbi:MAG: hypothetical protein QME06_06955 [Desulfobacterales bacterium]|nr:hypothetical protein [Desulfobacterales bacterium]